MQKITTVAELGRVLREARKAQGLTQTDFAELAGVGTRFVSELERGKETAELGLVLHVLATAGVDLTLRSRGDE